MIAYPLHIIFVTLNICILTRPANPLPPPPSNLRIPSTPATITNKGTSRLIRPSDPFIYEHGSYQVIFADYSLPDASSHYAAEFLNETRIVLRAEEGRSPPGRQIPGQKFEFGREFSARWEIYVNELEKPITGLTWDMAEVALSATDMFVMVYGTDKVQSASFTLYLSGLSDKKYLAEGRFSWNPV
ncbi:MAG: hypothetical protein Q9163_001584 [Psora crenata]